MPEQDHMTDGAQREEGPTEGASAAVQEDEIRMRAWEISQRADAGPPDDNWQRAIDELRDERGTAARP